MANPSESDVQNLLPVQAYFAVDGTFQTFIGQGQPFTATINPDQSGLNITNSTINSTTIGALVPSTGVFTDIATTTGTITSVPTIDTNIANKAYVDAVAQGLSFKQPALVTTTENITLSGLQTVDGILLVAGNRVLVRNQTNTAENGIYNASAGAWARSADANTWDELVASYLFIEEGTTWEGSAWVNTDSRGGTLGTTPVVYVQFSNNATYTAGTGLTLTGFQFSITNTGVSAATYGSASKTSALAINAQGQITSASEQDIAINGNQITSGTIGSSYLSGVYSGITGLGTLTDLTVTNTITGSISGNAATATSATSAGSATTATTATNIVGGASGSLPYQSASGTTAMLGIGTDGQILSLASGLPAWIDNQTGTVTSVSGTGTVSGISLSGTVTSSGSLTLGGTLDLSSPPAIGGTLPNSITASTLTVNDTTTLGSSNADTVNFTARINSEFTPATNNTYDLGRTGHEWRDLYITGTANIDSLVADTADINAGTIDNTVIGGTTPLAGTFTDLRINNTLSLAGSTGTSGYVVTSNGASAPTWQALPASGITITDDTSTNATRYVTFTSSTSGSITGENVSSTKLQYNPFTGTLSSTAFVGDGSGLTGVGGGFPSGTRMMFAQTSAPTGWTKDTTNYDNHAIRVVTGTASTGGSVNFTTAFASQTPTGSVSTSISAIAGTVGTSGGSTVSGTSDATTLTASQIPAHQHLTGIATEQNPYSTNVARYGYQNNWVNVRINYGQAAGYDTYSQSIGGGGSHTHTFTSSSHTHSGGTFSFTSGTASSSFSGSAINLAVKYLDVITATKD